MTILSWKVVKIKIMKYYISVLVMIAVQIHVKSHVDNVHIIYDRNYVNDNSKKYGGNCVCLHMVLSQK